MIRVGRTLFSAVLLSIILGCVSSGVPGDPNEQVNADASTRPEWVDPEIYSRINDPSDPFAHKYAEFRARRARDMASPESPRPLDRYPAFTRTREQAWGALDEILPFDWDAIRSVSPREARGLEAAIRVRRAFDHPDLEIIQLMLGAGAVLPTHADGAPGAYIVVAGAGEISVEGETRSVSPGATVRLSPYATRRIAAAARGPIRLLWIRWAPGGDQAYIDAGYYLTGANQHVQPRQADLPTAYLFWDAVYETRPIASPSHPVAIAPPGSSYARAADRLSAARRELGEELDLYPGTEVFGHESRRPWLSRKIALESGFFFAEDIESLGPVADRMLDIARHKAIFRATRANGRWDFNFSQSAWGPRASYVEHSHVIPEFYYVLSGPVVYGVDGERHRVVPGDILFNNSYSPHLALGIVDGLVFESFSSTFAPNGDRSVFDRPFFLIEPLPTQPASSRWAQDASFH